MQDQAKAVETLLEDNKRFVISENRYYISDRLNPTGPNGYYRTGEPEDQIYLREKILYARLMKILDIICSVGREDPRDEYTFDGTFYDEDDEDDEAGGVCEAIYSIIKLSQLNTLDPSVAIQKRFDGTLKREKRRLEDITLLSIFRDDLERILRDLYGDLENETLGPVLETVFHKVVDMIEFVRLGQVHFRVRKKSQK